MTDTITINDERFKVKPVLSQRGNKHNSAVWHLVCIGAKRTFVLVDELVYTAGYDQGRNSSEQWYLDSKHFGTRGNGSGQNTPSTPYLDDMLTYVEKAFQGNGYASEEVLSDVELVHHKMSIKEIKDSFSSL